MKIVATLRVQGQNFSRRAFNSFYKLHDSPVFILGNQKAGTTAIAALLAMSSGEEIETWVKNLTEKKLKSILKKEKTFASFCQQNRAYFCKKMVKENNLTFLYEELQAVFPKSKCMLIVRDPRDNIRSILNRVQVPGNLQSPVGPQLSSAPAQWKDLLLQDAMGGESRSYIENLAQRWNYASQVYLDQPEQVTLFKYEDFLKDKTGSIRDLAVQMGLNPHIDISSKVDVQFQRKGKRSVNWLEFFGKKNLQTINDICRENMLALGYSPDAIQPEKK